MITSSSFTSGGYPKLVKKIVTETFDEEGRVTERKVEEVYEQPATYPYVVYNT